MATEKLATWLCSLQFSNIPDNVVRAAIRSSQNWVGCAIAGSDHPATTIAYDALKPLFGPPVASLLGHNGQVRTDVQHAALLNGIASHVHDYDDTHLDTIIHPTGPIASALLATAEWKGNISGKDFLLALIVGIEVECKLGLAVWPQHYDVGWHITSTTGSIGAAAAVSKLLSLSVPQTAHALGIAATQVVGLREMFGSHTKSFHIGRAAQSGVLAALLAQGGYTSSETAIEAKRGWANVVGVTHADPQQGLDHWISGLTTGLPNPDGSRGRWEILGNSFKPFPCGIVIHPIIDACIQIHTDISERHLDVANIISVSAKVHPLVLELTGKKYPKDGLEAKFSVYHGGAAGLVYGKATPTEFEDSFVSNTVLVSVRDRITATADEDLRPDQAAVSVNFQDGTVLVKHIKHAVGSQEAPMSDLMLETKFIDQCERRLGKDGAGRANRACWNIAEVEDMKYITQYL